MAEWVPPKVDYWDTPRPVGGEDLKRIEGNIAVLEAAAKSHIDATSGIHGATSSATANRLVARDATGRAKVATPVEEDDIARKAEVDAHEGKTSTHGATATPTANRIAMYDMFKRLSSGAAPLYDNNVVRKVDIDNVETVNFTFGRAYVIRNFVHLYISGGEGVAGNLVTTLPSSVRPITPIFGAALTSRPGVPSEPISKLFTIGTNGNVYCYNKATEENVYISAFYIKG